MAKARTSLYMVRSLVAVLELAGRQVTDSLRRPLLTSISVGLEAGVDGDGFFWRVL